MSMYMFHKIVSIGALDEYILYAQFEDGVIKSYDVKQLFPKYPSFQQFLTEPDLFSKVHVDTGGYGIVWNEYLDLDSNEIWYNGRTEDSPFSHLLSFSAATSRWSLESSTLRKAIVYGKLIPGRDCCKYGKQWVVTTHAMIREYGQPAHMATETSCAAESGTEYNKP